MDDINYIELVSVTDEIRFREICRLLEDEKIPYTYDDEGDFLRLMSGFSVFEKTIYVSDKDYQRAKELLAYFTEDYGCDH